MLQTRLLHEPRIVMHYVEVLPCSYQAGPSSTSADGFRAMLCNAKSLLGRVLDPKCWGTSALLLVYATSFGGRKAPWLAFMLVAKVNGAVFDGGKMGNKENFPG